jgi:hypothetical protein
VALETQNHSQFTDKVKVHSFGVYSFFNFLCIICISAPALAWDPTTLAVGARSVSSILGGLDEAQEIADIGFEASQLFTDLGVDYGEDKAIQSELEKLEAFSRKSKELRWSSAELNRALETDLNRAKNLSGKIRSLRNVIRVSQNMATVFGLKKSTNDKALKVQDLRVSSMILEELQALRREHLLTYLEEKEQKTKRSLLLQEIIEKERKYHDPL